MLPRKPYVRPERVPLTPLSVPPLYGPVELVALPKDKPYRSDKWLAAVRALEFCVLCGRRGVQASHRNQGKGLSTKTDDCLCACLCVACHSAIDQGSQHTKAERRARLDSAILMTLVKLARKGLVKPT